MCKTLTLIAVSIQGEKKKVTGLTQHLALGDTVNGSSSCDSVEMISSPFLAWLFQSSKIISLWGTYPL